MYNEIRNQFLKHKQLFAVAHFLFTPFRIAREKRARRLMALEFEKRYHGVCHEDKKIVYLGIPEHTNLGDLAQTYCTREWVKQNYPNRILMEARTRVVFDDRFIERLKTLLNDDDIILCQSGYCTRDGNPDHEMHKRLVKSFPQYRIVILPQTVKLSSHREIRKTKEAFAIGERLLFFARDSISYEYAKRFVEDKKLFCFPDIVTSLIGRFELSANSDQHRSGILLCIRNDAEKYYTDNEVKDTLASLRKACNRVDLADTDSSKSIEELRENLERELREVVDWFASYKAIITDRYHGTIFSLVANTPVLVIKTNDHKVTSGVDWFRGFLPLESVRLVDSLTEAAGFALDYVHSSDSRQVNNDCLYQQYYSKQLFDIIENQEFQSLDYGSSHK